MELYYQVNANINDCDNISVIIKYDDHTKYNDVINHYST